MEDKFNADPAAARWQLHLVTNKRYRLLRYLIGILLLTILAVGFYFSTNIHTYQEPLFTWYKITIATFALLICYINMNWMVPRFLFCNRPSRYLLGLAGFLLLSFVAALITREAFLSIDQRLYIKLVYVPNVAPYLFIITICIASSTAIKLFQQWILDTAHINELIRAGMQSEMEQLKNQINPHFLFNMLNNANVLTQTDPAKASQVLIKLSDLLRYQLYDSARNLVLLTSEIRFLNDTLDLEKIRRDDFEYTVSKNGQISGIQVPPFLFITFVENAVKHSLSSRGSSFIRMYFDVQDESIEFTCINSKPTVLTKKSKFGGLGLKNVKRRLELLFPNRHLLEIQDEPLVYTVKLTIYL